MSRTEAMLPSIAAAHRPAPAPLSNLQTTLLEHEYRELVIAAYLYGFPLFEQARVIYNFCHSLANPRRVPVNAFGHGRVLTGVKEQKVTTPNSDTLYSSAIFDLSGGPIRLRVPAFGARYYSIAFIDAYTNVVACIWIRLQGGDGAVYLLSGPGGASPAPDAKTIQFHCNHIAALVRIQADGPQEYTAVHALQDQLTLESSPRPTPRNPIPPVLGDPQNFLAVVNQALGENPPAAAKAAFIEAFADIGLGPHLVPTAAQLQLWRDYFEMARNRLLQVSKSFGRMVNGWEYLPPATGSFGTDYLARAVIGLKGLWANIPAEQTYTFALLDDAGELLTGVRYTASNGARNATRRTTQPTSWASATDGCGSAGSAVRGSPGGTKSPSRRDTRKNGISFRQARAQSSRTNASAASARCAGGVRRMRRTANIIFAAGERDATRPAAGGRGWRISSSPAPMSPPGRCPSGWCSSIP
jgi:hypothetical protein